MNKARPRKRLGEILVESHHLLPEQLEAAIEKQKATGRRLGQVLLEMGFVTHEALIEALEQQLGVPHVWLRKGLVDPKVVHLIPREKAQLYNVIPMFKVKSVLTVASSDPSSVFALDDLEETTSMKIQAVLCRREDIKSAITEYYEEGMNMEGFLEGIEATDVEVVEHEHTQSLELVQEQAEGGKVINLVNLALLNAIRDGASDVHIEPQERNARIRYRLDGVLHEAMTPRMDLHPAIVSRIKVMANMDIAERHLPQDGRIRIATEGREIDVRVSTMPTIMGEKVVMRILDSAGILLDINQLGFAPDTLVTIKRMLFRPHGIILVTGPTGSGKTTTLYSAINLISSIEKNIVTIEDPVEYQLPVINQIPVNEARKLTFPKVLRSVLRQDPDIIMVGEIRDRETAEVAIQAALTGHLVLSTLHTNESVGAVARLLEMGIEPYLLTSTVAGVVAQRLVRLVCEDCKTPYFPPASLLERIGWTEEKEGTFFKGVGCSRCYDSGLRGRSAIFELLQMTEEVRSLILKSPSLDELRNLTKRIGMSLLKHEGLALAAEGRTTIEEVMRVVFIDQEKGEYASVA